MLLNKLKKEENIYPDFNGLPRLILNEELIGDLIKIYNGAYSPVTGFLGKGDFESVVKGMRLKDGRVWPIPIVLDIDSQEKKAIERKKVALLHGYDGTPLGLLKNPEVYENDKDFYAKGVYGTTNLDHPGVKEVYLMKGYLLGGGFIDFFKPIKFLNVFCPLEIRKIFKQKNWKTIVAFQTRNAPHRSHEYLQKLALEQVDGLFIQPVVGKKKPGDFRDEVILDTYKMILSKYYPKERTHLAPLPLRMRYAGPREAVFHALIRKNYGCTHFIVGRDHAGVGDYYGPYDAHKIFDNFTNDEIGIKIIKFDNAFHCHECGNLVMDGQCNHSKESRVFLSGTQIRQMIKNKEDIPEEFMRKEVSEYLINHPNPFVD